MQKSCEVQKPRDIAELTELHIMQDELSDPTKGVDWKISTKVVVDVQIPFGFGWVKNHLVENILSEVGRPDSPFTSLTEKAAVLFQTEYWRDLPPGAELTA